MVKTFPLVKDVWGLDSFKIKASTTGDGVEKTNQSKLSSCLTHLIYIFSFQGSLRNIIILNNQM